MTLPRVVVFGDLLSADECAELIALARSRLARSETVETATGASAVNPARTSDGMFFEPGEFPVCARLEKRIAALLGWPLENGEGLQILRYGPGTEYKPHYDYFDPDEPGTPAILKRGGQRVGSLVCYLNTPEAGGATVFPDAGLEVAPVRGNAVFFSYDRPHPATRTLHGGAPVDAGEKWVATKQWMRECDARARGPAVEGVGARRRCRPSTRLSTHSSQGPDHNEDPHRRRHRLGRQLRRFRPIRLRPGGRHADGQADGCRVRHEEGEQATDGKQGAKKKP